MDNADNYISHRSISQEFIIKVPIYYFVDDEGKIVVDEECMSEEFNEKLLKVSSILNGKKEGK
jgi:hypothetical protein